MGRTLCVANQKGGVGKTTTAISLSATLSKAGGRTLLVDLDPQCNATTGLGQQPTKSHPLIESVPIRQGVVSAGFPLLDVLPGSRSIHHLEATADDGGQLYDGLREQLVRGFGAYDFVLLDCPPSLGQLTQVALACSHEVLIPIQCEYFAMEGLAQMIEVIRGVMGRETNQLEFGGIVMTMFDHTLDLTHEVDQEVREFFGDMVYQTTIPRDVCISESPSHGKSVVDYAPRARGARAYVELCMEVLERD